MVEGYQIQMGDGMTYTNVSDITFQILHDHPYIYCLNSENGQNGGCRDWKVKYCCAQPKPKCYCCPPIDPPNTCVDTNNLCSSAFNGTGTCVDITNPDWDALDHHYDISEPGIPGACSASGDESCCRCFKNKTCMDTGCKDEFGGDGICLETQGDMTKYHLDLEAGHDPKPDLCKHTWDKDCCSCFKLAHKGGKHCKNDMCKEKGGKCVMPDQYDVIMMNDVYILKVL